MFHDPDQRNTGPRSSRLAFRHAMVPGQPINPELSKMLINQGIPRMLLWRCGGGLAQCGIRIRLALLPDAEPNGARQSILLPGMAAMPGISQAIAGAICCYPRLSADTGFVCDI